MKKFLQNLRSLASRLLFSTNHENIAFMQLVFGSVSILIYVFGISPIRVNFAKSFARETIKYQEIFPIWATLDLYQDSLIVLFLFVPMLANFFGLSYLPVIAKKYKLFSQTSDEIFLKISRFSLFLQPIAWLIAAVGFILHFVHLDNTSSFTLPFSYFRNNYPQSLDFWIVALIIYGISSVLVSLSVLCIVCNLNTIRPPEFTLWILVVSLFNAITLPLLVKVLIRLLSHEKIRIIFHSGSANYKMLAALFFIVWIAIYMVPESAKKE